MWNARPETLNEFIDINGLHKYCSRIEKLAGGFSVCSQFWGSDHASATWHYYYWLRAVSYFHSAAPSWFQFSTIPFTFSYGESSVISHTVPVYIDISRQKFICIFFLHSMRMLNGYCLLPTTFALCHPNRKWWFVRRFRDSQRMTQMFFESILVAIWISSACNNMRIRM